MEEPAPSCECAQTESPTCTQAVQVKGSKGFSKGKGTSFGKGYFQPSYGQAKGFEYGKGKGKCNSWGGRGDSKGGSGPFNTSPNVSQPGPKLEGSTGVSSSTPSVSPSMTTPHHGKTSSSTTTLPKGGGSSQSSTGSSPPNKTSNSAIGQRTRGIQMSCLCCFGA